MADIPDATQTNQPTPLQVADPTTPVVPPPVAEPPPEPMPEPSPSGLDNLIVPATDEVMPPEPPKAEELPKKDQPNNKRVNPKVLIAGLIILFITLPLIGLAVKNTLQIRSQAFMGGDESPAQNAKENVPAAPKEGPAQNAKENERPAPPAPKEGPAQNAKENVPAAPKEGPAQNAKENVLVDKTVFSSEGFMGGSDTRNVQMSDPSKGIYVDSYFGATKQGTMNFSGIKSDGQGGTIVQIVRAGATDKTPGGIIGTVTTSGSGGENQTVFTVGEKKVTCTTSGGEFRGCNDGSLPVQNLTDYLVGDLVPCSGGVCPITSKASCLASGTDAEWTSEPGAECGPGGYRLECHVGGKWYFVGCDNTNRPPGEHPGTPTTPTPTTQCVNIIAFKDGQVLTSSQLAALHPGDIISLRYSPGGSATKVRFRVNSGSWNESTTTDNGYYTWDYTLGNSTSFSVEAQWFDGTNWN